jgi:hypothetical protein
LVSSLKTANMGPFLTEEVRVYERCDVFVFR